MNYLFAGVVVVIAVFLIIIFRRSDKKDKCCDRVYWCSQGCRHYAKEPDEKPCRDCVGGDKWEK